MKISKYGIKNASVFHQLSINDLQKIIISNNEGQLVNSGALAINTGEFTGRSPKDRFIVKDLKTKDLVWWGDINIPFNPLDFNRLYNKITKYLLNKDIYVRDSYVCALDEYHLNIRTICEMASSDMFVNNMFLRLNKNQINSFEEDWLIINVPNFYANPLEDNTRKKNFSIINFTSKIIIIGGTGYTGEIKKGIFSVLNFILPTEKNILPMHCSSNVGNQGDTSIFFGLSGTGKTTLSSDGKRKLVGDDEHGWSEDNKIFNFEGGCYAKVINLKKENEPDIYQAIKSGALLENVIITNDGEVNYADKSITQNTRVSYPINHISNIKIPSVSEMPRNIFFLTADAFGILPPISKLNPSQAAYHFISGYTSKVAGTEAGVVNPEPFFSSCFGSPFMPLHPAKYAKMLIDKMRENNVIVWLVNTGWTGGPYGIGERMELKYTRAMISAAMNGELEKENKGNYHIHSVFNLLQPRTCPNVPNSILSPRKTWNNDIKYYKTAYKLAKSFIKNFENFESYANDEIMKGKPNLE